MNGAQIVIKTAVAAGIQICFANPGTTEMPLVEALDSVPGIQAKLGLFEGCCTGAADGYGRMTGFPALTLLHLGPGLANGIANLHNAHRAGTPVVNIIGHHASWHCSADSPLSMDIQTLAGVIPLICFDEYDRHFFKTVSPLETPGGSHPAAAGPQAFPAPG